MAGGATYSFCRIGVFYDGSYFEAAQKYYYHKRQLGWLEFRQFHFLIESCVRAKESGYASHRVVYAAWFQGLFSASKANEHHLRSDRNLHQDLLHAGIEPRFVPTSPAGREKGVDVALAIDAVKNGFEGKIDVAVIISGDGDFVPLARALMKHGVRVMAAYFKFADAEPPFYVNERFVQASNYTFDLGKLETDKEFKSVFKGCFGQRQLRSNP